MTWLIDKDVVFLNHGSFGACPKWILNKQQEYRNRLESEPVRFMIRELETMHTQAREVLAGFTGANPADLVFVTNATTGINTVFRSLRFMPGDEILITDHIYPACMRLLEFICELTGARLVEASIPFPLRDPGVITDKILSAVTERTKIALIDHITAATAIILPVGEIVKELDRRGVDTFVDGAHALGQISIRLDEIGAAYYTSNCHKWLCAPKSAAILHIRKDKQRGIVPAVISHAGHKAEPFSERFYWPATYDPTPILCAADMVKEMENHYPGGWPAIMERNHKLCMEARAMICRELELPDPCSPEMVGSMSTMVLPKPEVVPVFDYKSSDPLQDRLFKEHQIEVPVWYFGKDQQRIIRISTHLYNHKEQYRFLLDTLKPMLSPGFSTSK
jgi:isopenicillin-N epimerase